MNKRARTTIALFLFFILSMSAILTGCSQTSATVTTGTTTSGTTTSGTTTSGIVTTETVTVTFDLSYSGAPNPSTVTTADGSAVSRPVSDPVRSGYRFEGWFTQASGGSRYVFTSAVTGDLTLYARWTRLYVITFNLNYTGAPTPTTIAVAEGEMVPQELAPATTGYEGFLFDGWHTDILTSSLYDFSAAVSGDLTLYAHWEELTQEDVVYDVTFDYNFVGAPLPTVSIIKEGNKVSQPSAPSRYAYTFDGWHTDIDSSSVYDFNAPVTQELTLYAHWTAAFYVIEYKYSIGETVTLYETIQATANEYVAADLVPMPVVPGYSFRENNWYIDQEYSALFDFDNTRINQNYTLYAKPLIKTKYTFEAEYVDLTDKEGTVYSSGANEEELIVIDSVAKRNQEASNGYSIGHMYVPWIFIEFVINSDVDVDNVKLEARLSGQYRDIYIAPKSQILGGKEYWSFTFAVNESPEDVEQVIRSNGVLLDGMLNYSPIALEGVPPELNYPMRKFSNYVISENVSLKAGENRILLMVTNNGEYASTIIACAPMIDCLYITTDAVLTWTPKTENLAKAVDRE